MYCLSEQQIDYILNDIRARGVKTESLQLNLLDHICCCIEQELAADGDFESFYAATIKTFYKDELREIEVETLNLLTYKNYYVMKKIMIGSGTLSALTLSLGIFFKFQHWPGASFLMVVGITSFSLLFLPLVFLLKVKESPKAADRLIIGLGTLSAALFSLGILFKIMWWPGANVMGVAVLAIMGLVFLPIYFFTGIRQAETKVNTIVTSILIVAGCGLFLSLVKSPAGVRKQSIADTSNFVRNQQLFLTERRLAEQDVKDRAINPATLALTNEIVNTCEEIKTYLVEAETGESTIDAYFEAKNTVLSERRASDYFEDGKPVTTKLETLKQAIEKYNTATVAMANPNLQPIAVKATVLESRDTRLTTALNDFIQIQMAAIQNERELASK